MVASAPTFMSSSPSPVTTRTRLAGPASAGPEPHHAGRAHRAAERIDVGAVAGDRADVAGAASQAGDEQEILVAPDQRRHRFAPLEHEARRGGGCQSFGTGHHSFLKTVCSIKTVWRLSAAARAAR